MSEPIRVKADESVIIEALSKEDHEQLILEFDLDMAKACSLEAEDCEACQ